MEDVTDKQDLWCQMFTRTLEGESISWYANLPAGCIHNFSDLRSKFVETFGHRIKRKLESYYNTKVKSKHLIKGDLVLRNAQLTGKEQDKEKLSPNWEGPYVIKEIVREGTYILTDNNRKTLPRTWYANFPKKLYM